ncbi:hypothetical protein AVEN_94378-1 [Araneus ventricosus]|uniref:HTH CENPB-type domain-containing protein n=1 Tax=Araneus ventricosus TaxID=182803 RepID=A0A4Y2ECC8_ARAVE|nr:hypothetical protein AVEN_94378-1 [Araneus ventricosus]
MRLNCSVGIALARSSSKDISQVKNGNFKKNVLTTCVRSTSTSTLNSVKPFNEIPSDLSLPIVGTTWMSMPLVVRIIMESKRKRLRLKEKIDVLEVAEKEKLSVLCLSERFKVGKTQISELLIRKMWMVNSNKNSKNLKFHKIERSEIYEVVIKWFRSARAKKIPISVVLFQEKAREIGRTLVLDTFKALNG